MRVEGDGNMSWIDSLLDGSLFSGSIFLVIGIAGGVLLLLSLVLDGIFEAFDFGDGPLSLTSIAAFISIFGFAAFAGVGAGLDSPPAAAVGAGAGLVGGAAAWWLSRLVRRAETNTAVESKELIGVEGAVVLAIPADGLGEIAVTMHGERVSLSATADAPVSHGTRVRVVQTLTSTSVHVEPVLPESGSLDT